MGLNRRALGQALLVAGLAAAFGTGAVGQASGEMASNAARSFIDDLLAVSVRNDVGAMDAFLRERVDTRFAFETAFAPVDGIVSPGQKDRLAALMLRFLAREALAVGEVARGGEFQLAGTERVEAGTLVEGMFRDAAGDYPFTVLVGPESADGRQLILDFGSPRASTVVTRLAYATNALAQVSPDAEVWITAFEQAVGF